MAGTGISSSTLLEGTIVNNSNMVKTYYRSEYSDKQWRALMDTAAELGCQVTYGKYGDRAVIDSTDRENALVNGKTLELCGLSISTRCCRTARTSESGGSQEIPQRLLPYYMQI